MTPERQELLEVARKHFFADAETLNAEVGLIFVYRDIQSDFVIIISKPYWDSVMYYNESFVSEPNNLYPDTKTAIIAAIDHAEFFGIRDVNLRSFDMLDGEIEP